MMVGMVTFYFYSFKKGDEIMRSKVHLKNDVTDKSSLRYNDASCVGVFKSRGTVTYYEVYERDTFLEIYKKHPAYCCKKCLKNL